MAGEGGAEAKGLRARGGEEKGGDDRVHVCPVLLRMFCFAGAVFLFPSADAKGPPGPGGTDAGRRLCEAPAPRGVLPRARRKETHGRGEIEPLSKFIVGLL